MTERESYGWWSDLVGKLKLASEFREFLLSLRVTREVADNKLKLMADTPDGRREVFFSTVSGAPVIAYQKDKQTINSVIIPGLPHEEITRGGPMDKSHWGEVEE